MIFLSSDHHFGHGNIIRLCNRPFKTVEEMDDVLIDNINRVVGENDELLHLGDFTWYKDHGKIADIFNRIVCKRVTIIPGNHDNMQTLESVICCRITTKTVTIYREPYTETFLENKKVILCHYPLEDWNGKYRGSYHFHGHTHGQMKTKIHKRLEVGVDCVPNYSPISLSDAFAMSESWGKH